jgi:hypothetical protein
MLGTTATLAFVTLAWVLFRAPDIQTMLGVYSKLLFVNSDGATWYYSAALSAIAWTLLGHAFSRARNRNLQPKELEAFEDFFVFKTPYSFLAAFSIVLTLLIIYIFAPNTVNPFVYFQF